MFKNISNLWNQLFLRERPSLGLSFFRIFAALTVGLHVIPSFFHLDDNFLCTAFKEINLNFFTPQAISLVQSSPDGVVYFFVVLFCITWLFFLVGLFSQISCIVMVICCYYFYALNCLHIGTLSWDILLVTMFLMCATSYHGDYFSLDCLLRRDTSAYKQKRPFFIQRLLQMQIAFNYFYTALYKITGPGNWLHDNPIYYLMNYPPEGVVKQFPLREFFAHEPWLCYLSGILIVISELSMPLLLWWPRTRVFAIVYGLFFHIILVVTLHVPTIFFFLFPPQLLLFINPDDIAGWIERKRQKNKEGGKKVIVVYDGQCGFCGSALEKLEIMDLFGVIEGIDFNQVQDLRTIHPDLTKELAQSQLYLIDSQEKLYSGFFAFRNLSLKLPMMFVLIPVFYFPGMNLIGPFLYSVVAKNRHLLHFGKTCRNNSCFR